MIHSETTVREVALQIPQATRLFEKLKIDYCCGGTQPLGKACASAGVDVDNVIEILVEVTQSTSPDAAGFDFQNASLPELIEHILNTHHVFTKSEMDRLEALTVKVISAHGGNHPELIQLGELFRRLCDDLKPHIFKRRAGTLPLYRSHDPSSRPESAWSLRSFWNGQQSRAHDDERTRYRRGDPA